MISIAFLDVIISRIAFWVVRNYMGHLLELHSISISILLPSPYLILTLLFNAIYIAFKQIKGEVDHYYNDEQFKSASIRVLIRVEKVKMSPWLTNLIHSKWERFPIHLVMLTCDRVSIEIVPFDVLNQPLKMSVVKPVLEFQPYRMNFFKGADAANDAGRYLWFYESGLPVAIERFNEIGRGFCLWSAISNIILNQMEFDAYDILIAYQDTETNPHASHIISLEVGSFQRFSVNRSFGYQPVLDLWGRVFQVKISCALNGRDFDHRHDALDYTPPLEVKFELPWNLFDVTYPVEKGKYPFFAKAFLRENVILNLNADVVDVVHDIIQFGFNFQSLKKYQSFRPFFPVKSNSRMWWKYAIRCVTSEIRRKSSSLGRFSWSQLADYFQARKRYIRLYAAMKILPSFIQRKYFEKELLRLTAIEKEFPDEILASIREQASLWKVGKSVILEKLGSLGTYLKSIGKMMTTSARRQVSPVNLPGYECQLAVDAAELHVEYSKSTLMHIFARGFGFKIAHDAIKFEVGGHVDWFDFLGAAGHAEKLAILPIISRVDDEGKFSNDHLRLCYGCYDAIRSSHVDGEEPHENLTEHEFFEAIIPPLRMFVTSSFVHRFWNFISHQQLPHERFERYEVITYSSEEKIAKEAIKSSQQHLKSLRLRCAINIAVKDIDMIFANYLEGDGTACLPAIRMQTRSFLVSGGIADERLAFSHVKESLSYASEHKLSSSLLSDTETLEDGKESQRWSDRLRNLIYDEDGSVMYDHVAASVGFFSLLIVPEQHVVYEFLKIGAAEGHDTQVVFLDCFYSVLRSTGYEFDQKDSVLPWTASVRVSPVNIRVSGRTWSCALNVFNAFQKNLLLKSWISEASESRKEIRNEYSGQIFFPKHWFERSNEITVENLTIADAFLSNNTTTFRNLSLEILSVAIFVENSQSDHKNMAQPIFDINCSNLKCRLVWTEFAEIDCDMNLSVRIDVFDYKRLVWIPALEPWSFSLSLSQDILHHAEISFSVSEDERLNFDVSKIFVEQACLALKELSDLIVSGSDLSAPKRILRNYCGEDIKVWTNTDSLHQTISAGEDSDILSLKSKSDLKLHLLSSGKHHSNHQFGAFRALQYFSLQLSDGFSVENIPVLQGKTLIPLLGPRTGSCAVVSVDHIQRSTIVEISSQIKIQNHCAISYEALLTSGTSSKFTVILIRPYSFEFIPLEFANSTTIQFRPLAQSTSKHGEKTFVFQECFQVRPSEATSTVSVVKFGDFSYAEARGSSVMGAIALESNVFHNPLEVFTKESKSSERVYGVHFINEAVPLDKLDDFAREISKGSTSRDVPIERFTNILHLVPPVTIQNRTFSSFWYRIFCREDDGSLNLLKESLLRTGEDIDLFFANSELLFSIRLRTDPVHGKFEWTIPCSIRSGGKLKCRLPLLSTPKCAERDGPQFCFFANLETEPRVCGVAGTFLTIFFEFWLVNLTSSPLMFRESNPLEKNRIRARLLPSHRESTDLSSTIILPYDKVNSKNVRQLSYGHPGASCEIGLNTDSLMWSKRVTLEEIIQTTVDVKSDDDVLTGSCRQLAIQVNEASGKFFRTKIISLLSAISFCNQTPYPISIRQSGSDQSMTIGPGDQYDDFVFGCKSLPKSVRIAFPNDENDGKEDCSVDKWSGEIDLSRTQWGTRAIYWDGMTEDIHWVDIHLKLRGMVMFVVFSPGDVRFPPIRVDNFSLFPVNISQQNLNESFLVQPLSSRTFAFREPFLQQSIQIEVHECRTLLSLSDIGNKASLALAEAHLDVVVKSDGPIKVLHIAGGVDFKNKASQDIVSNISKQLEFLEADYDLIKQRYQRTQHHLNKKAAPPATLRVKLIQCRDLFSNSNFRAPDVACSLKIGKSIVESSNRPKSYHPYFNEEFVFRLSSITQTLVVNVNDGRLGSVSIQLNQISPNTRIDKWFDLEFKQDREMIFYSKPGKVRLQLLLVDGREALVARNMEEFVRISSIKKKEMSLLRSELGKLQSSPEYRPGLDWSVYNISRRSTANISSSAIKHVTCMNRGKFKLTVASIELSAMSSSTKTYRPYVSVQYGSNSKPIVISKDVSLEQNVCQIDSEIRLDYVSESDDGLKGTPIRLAIFHKDDFANDPFLGECFVYPSDFFDLPERHGLRQWIDLQALNRDNIGQTIELEFFAESTRTLGHILIRFEWIEKNLEAELFNFKAQVSIPKIGISIVDEDRSRELMFIAVSAFDALWMESRESSKYWLQISNLQVDNPSPTSPNPVFVSTIRSATKTFSPFLQVSLMRTKLSDLFEFFPHFSVSMRELKVRADDKILVETIVFLDEIFQLMVHLYWRPSIIKPVLPLESPPKPDLGNRRGAFFNAFDVGSVNFNITFVNAGEESPEFRIRILEVLIHTLSKVDLRDARIDLLPFNFKNSFVSYSDLGSMMISHYTSQVFLAFATIAGSTSTLGNPAYLSRSICQGLYDFATEPYSSRGSLKSLFAGVARGSRSLGLNFVIGFSNSFNSLLTNFAGLLAAWSADDQFAEYFQRRLNRLDRGEFSPVQIMYQGLKSFRSGVVSGLTGLVSQPINGLHRSGKRGLVKGAFSAVVGFAVKPLAGTIQLLATSQRAIHDAANTAQYGILEQSVPVRYPRPFQYGNVITQYDESQALGQYVMLLLHDYAFSGDVLVECVQTDDEIFVLCTLQEILIVHVVLGKRSSLPVSAKLIHKLRISEVLKCSFESDRLIFSLKTPGKSEIVDVFLDTSLAQVFSQVVNELCTEVIVRPIVTSSVDEFDMMQREWTCSEESVSDTKLELDRVHSEILDLYTTIQATKFLRSMLYLELKGFQFEDDSRMIGQKFTLVLSQEGKEISSYRGMFSEKPFDVLFLVQFISLSSPIIIDFKTRGSMLSIDSILCGSAICVPEKVGISSIGDSSTVCIPVSRNERDDFSVCIKLTWKSAQLDQLGRSLEEKKHLESLLTQELKESNTSEALDFKFVRLAAQLHIMRNDFLSSKGEVIVEFSDMIWSGFGNIDSGETLILTAALKSGGGKFATLKKTRQELKATQENKIRAPWNLKIGDCVEANNLHLKVKLKVSRFGGLARTIAESELRIHDLSRLMENRDFEWINLRPLIKGANNPICEIQMRAVLVHLKYQELLFEYCRIKSMLENHDAVRL